MHANGWNEYIADIIMWAIVNEQGNAVCMSSPIGYDYMKALSKGSKFWKKNCDNESKRLMLKCSHWDKYWVIIIFDLWICCIAYVAYSYYGEF